MILLLATVKVLLVVLPIFAIFYFGDKGKWDDPGCTLLGGKDLMYND